jgi:hypothetical protein
LTNEYKDGFMASGTPKLIHNKAGGIMGDEKGSGIIVLDIDGCTENPIKGAMPDQEGQKRIYTYVQCGIKRSSHRIVINTGRCRNYTEVAARNIGDPEDAIIEQGSLFFKVRQDQVTLNPAVNGIENRPTIEQVKRLLPDRVSFYPGKEVCITVTPQESMPVSELYQITYRALAKQQADITHTPEAVNIMPEGIDKGTGLLYIVDLWKTLGDEIDLSKSLGIGDSHNDFSFFKVIRKAGGKIGCPCNATHECTEYIKKYGGFIATQTFASGTADIIDVFFGKQPQAEVQTCPLAT